MRMSKHVMLSLSVIFLVILAVSFAVLPVLAEEQEQKMSEQEKKMMDLWRKYTTPGENHKHIEYFVGEWESIMKSWAGPAKEPRVRTQEIKVEPFFQGRFTKAHIKTHADDIGKILETMVINGYDNFKEEFFSITLSKQRTDFFVTSGKLDKTGKIRTDTAVRTDFFTGKQYGVKAVTTIINRDKYTYVYYRINPDGTEKKNMEITYTRKK